MIDYNDLSDEDKAKYHIRSAIAEYTLIYRGKPGRKEKDRAFLQFVDDTLRGD